MVKILIGIVAAFAIGCSTAENTSNVSNVQTANVNSKFSTTNTVTVTAPAIPESQLANTGSSAGARTFIDGSQIVGKDVEPGTYRTRAGTGNCRWTRRSGFAGDAADVLATGTAGGPAIVTIRSTDKGFESAGCGLWTSDLSTITGSPTAPFGDGDYMVGTDIAPGTWKAQDAKGCYWARVKDFTGEPADTIGNANGSGIVTIQKSDKGFVSSGCGSWTFAGDAER